MLNTIEAIDAVDDGAVTSERDVVNTLKRLSAVDCPTLEPLLPLMFSLRGKPYTLKRHFPFAAAFRTRVPRARTLLCARQVGKTQFLAVSGATVSARYPYSVQLFVTPLFEQIRRFSSNYMAPLIEESPIRSWFVDAKCNHSVLQRSFRNKSTQHFGYAGTSVDRLRGIGGVWVTHYDERQDMMSEHIHVVDETMSAAPPPWGLTVTAGTPKGFDNPIQIPWGESSQAEWFVKCRAGGCGHWNIFAIEHDLMAVIGPASDDIGPNRPGTVCAKCRKPIDPATGGWKHRWPELRWEHQGLHVPQPILPMHYADPVKWAVLVAKMHGRGNMSPTTFQTEVLGSACDIGAKLVSETELRAACVLPPNEPGEPSPAVTAANEFHAMTVLAIDWGGGGGSKAPGSADRRVSFTTLAYMGIDHDGKINVLWGRRLLTPNDHAAEAIAVLRLYERLRPTVIAHDFTGAGVIRETLLSQSGIPRDRIVGFDYKYAPRGVMIKFESGENSGQRPHYRVDKTRTLLTTVNAIRLGGLRFFAYDFKGDSDRGLIRDFLSLTEEKIETAAADRYLIRRAPGFSDDFAQAVNIGCCALWHSTSTWPDFAKSAASSPDYVDDSPSR